MDAAPELIQSIQQLSSQVPGLKFARVRPQKDESRLDEKQDANPPNTLSDYLGAQVAADTPEAKDALIELLRKNFKTIEVDDHFLTGKPDKAGYPSANVQIQMGNGLSAEVQIIPREVADVVLHSHAFYKAGRDAEERGDQGERDRQWAEAAKINQGKLEEFKQRNGIGNVQDTVHPDDGESNIFDTDVQQNAIQDPHAPLRQSLDAAGVQPIKLGGKLFYALNPESENPDLGSAPAAAAPRPDAVTEDGRRSVDRATEENVPRPALSKGQRVTLPNGQEGEVAFLHPEMSIARVRTPQGVVVVNPKDLTPVEET